MEADLIFPEDGSCAESQAPALQSDHEASTSTSSRLQIILRRIPQMALAAAVFFATENPIDPGGMGGWRHN
jgi:hypothetical protein